MHKFISNTAIAFLLASSLYSPDSFATQSHGSRLVIDIPETTYVLPRFTGPFRQREASISPEEYEMAEELRQLLDQNKTDDVMARLERFYNIELSIAMLTLKAQVYFSLEQYDQAERAYLFALTRQPELVRAHADLGQLYMLTDRPIEARRYFANAISYGLNDPAIHGQLGYLNLTQHSPFSAISSYKYAMSLEPENIQWQQGLLSAFSQAKMFDSASALLDEMLTRDSENPDLWLNKAAISLQQQDMTSTLTALEMAMLLGEQSHNNLKAAAQLHLQRGSYNRAVEIIESDLSINDISMDIVDQYLTWLHQASMPDKTESILASLAARLETLEARDLSLYYQHWAKLEYEKGNFDLAEEHYRKANRIDPTNGRAILELADLYSEKGRHSDAEILYFRAQGIDEHAKPAILALAQLYIDMGEYSSALEQLRRAYNQYPDLIRLRDSIEIVENIIRAENRSAIQ